MLITGDKVVALSGHDRLLDNTERSNSFDEPLVGVCSTVGMISSQHTRELPLATAVGSLPFIAEADFLEMLDGGTSSISDSANSTTLSLADRITLPNLLLCLFFVGVAMTCTPLANGFRVGCFDSTGHQQPIM